MSREKELEKLVKEYKETEVPTEAKERMEAGIRRAKMENKRNEKRRMRNIGIGMAAALALLVLPNTNENIAYAMGNIPVVGKLFEVITVREYVHENENSQANVKVPEIKVEDTEDEKNSEAVAEVNKSAEEYTSELIAEFEKKMEDKGHHGLDVSYETVTDTDKWFTLRIDALDTEASGYQVKKFYHIDKTTGQTAELKDIFKKDADYITPISEEILRQMKEQMEAQEAMYFIEDDGIIEPFKQIAENQNFYFNENGDLVIAFDEYEVAPGYIGTPEFVIPHKVVEGILK